MDASVKEWNQAWELAYNDRIPEVPIRIRMTQIEALLAARDLGREERAKNKRTKLE